MELLGLTMMMLGLTFGASRVVGHPRLRLLGAPTVRAIVLGIVLAVIQHALLFDSWASRLCALEFSDRLAVFAAMSITAVTGLVLGFTRSSLAGAMLWRSFVVAFLVLGVVLAIAAYVGLSSTC